MSTITREVWINAPKEEVWAALADFGNIYLFNPSVPNSYLTSDQKRGVGTTRHCDFNIEGASVEERIVEWTDSKSMLVEIYDGQKNPPFKKVLAGFELNEERGGTLVRGTMDFSLKYGPAGLLMDKLMVKPQFAKAWGGIFAGLKHYVETGETVNSMGEIDLAPVAAVA